MTLRFVGGYHQQQHGAPIRWVVDLTQGRRVRIARGHLWTLHPPAAPIREAAPARDSR